MTIDDQESAGAARPGHGAGAMGQAWAGMGHRQEEQAGRSMSMSMSIEHDLPRRHGTQCRPLFPASCSILYSTYEFSQPWMLGCRGSLLLPAPPHTDVQSSGCKNAPSHSPSHPDLTIARDQASTLPTSPPASPPRGASCKLHRTEQRMSKMHCAGLD